MPIENKTEDTKIDRLAKLRRAKEILDKYKKSIEADEKEILIEREKAKNAADEKEREDILDEISSQVNYNPKNINIDKIIAKDIASTPPAKDELVYKPKEYTTYVDPRKPEQVKKKMEDVNLGQGGYYPQPQQPQNIQPPQYPQPQNPQYYPQQPQYPQQYIPQQPKKSILKKLMAGVGKKEFQNTLISVITALLVIAIFAKVYNII